MLAIALLNRVLCESRQKAAWQLGQVPQAAPSRAGLINLDYRRSVGPYLSDTAGVSQEQSKHMNHNPEARETPKNPTAIELLQMLKNACDGKHFAAVRIKTELLPVAGKVFPPTYSGGQYATECEQKNDKGEVERAQFVLLDSVQSQANRMELALLNAIDAGRITLPIIRVKVDFQKDGKTYRYPNINSYTVPHRVSDAIIRDSVIKETDAKGKETEKHFWESVIGTAITGATIQNARPFYRYCPTALLLGTWDSHSFTRRGLKSAKVARALCSEVVGVEAKPGKRTASRIDPLHLSGFYMVKTGEGEYEWKIEEGEPEKDKKKRLAKKQMKVSEIGHGNVTPDFKNEEGQKHPGGFYISQATQTAVLSFPQLRRLSFADNLEDLIKNSQFDKDPNPVLEEWQRLDREKKGAQPDNAREFEQKIYTEQEKVNIAGRTVIAALGLLAVALLQESPDGFNLRSRCDLLPRSEPRFEFLPLKGGEGDPQTIDSETAIKVLEEAVKEAKELGLVWRTEPVELEAGPELQRLIVASEAAQLKDGVEEP